MITVRKMRRDYSLESNWTVALFLVCATVSLLAITSYYHFVGADRLAAGPGPDEQHYPIRFSIATKPSVTASQATSQNPDAPAPDQRASGDMTSELADAETARQTADRAIGQSIPRIQPGPTQIAGSAAVASSLPQPGRNGVIQLSFDLSDLTPRQESRPSTKAKASDIDIRKRVRAGGQDLGEITVRVDKYSRLAVDTAQLRTVLQEQPKLAASSDKLPETGMIGFTELRNRGVDLRYDPIADRLTLHSI